MFYSDNGGPCDQNSSVNAPYRGQKGILLEGGVHVPFIMNWPGTLPAGKRFNDPVSSLDVAPTFTALAGDGAAAPARPFDGVNLMPYLRGEKTDLADRQLKWRFTISTAIRQGKWKLVRLPDRLPQLYDLSNDIAEQNNVASKNLAQTQSMLKTLGQWDVHLPYPAFFEGAGWMSKQVDLYDDAYPITQPARDGKLVFTAPPKIEWK